MEYLKIKILQKIHKNVKEKSLNNQKLFPKVIFLLQEEIYYIFI